jgi:hypothetical protein
MLSLMHTLVLTNFRNVRNALDIRADRYTLSMY